MDHFIFIKEGILELSLQNISFSDIHQRINNAKEILVKKAKDYGMDPHEVLDINLEMDTKINFPLAMIKDKLYQKRNFTMYRSSKGFYGDIELFFGIASLVTGTVASDQCVLYFYDFNKFKGLSGETYVINESLKETSFLKMKSLLKIMVTEYNSYFRNCAMQIEKKIKESERMINLQAESNLDTENKNTNQIIKKVTPFKLNNRIENLLKLSQQNISTEDIDKNYFNIKKFMSNFNKKEKRYKNPFITSTEKPVNKRFISLTKSNNDNRNIGKKISPNKFYKINAKHYRNKNSQDKLINAKKYSNSNNKSQSNDSNEDIEKSKEKKTNPKNNSSFGEYNPDGEKFNIADIFHNDLFRTLKQTMEFQLMPGKKETKKMFLPPILSTPKGLLNYSIFSKETKNNNNNSKIVRNNTNEKLPNYNCKTYLSHLENTIYNKTLPDNKNINVNNSNYENNKKNRFDNIINLHFSEDKKTKGKLKIQKMTNFQNKDVRLAQINNIKNRTSVLKQLISSYYTNDTNENELLNSF